MIICHPQRTIFVETKKIAGTSFEIALSGLCGPDCTITPISPVDEALRKKLECRGAQNYQHPVWHLGPDNATYTCPVTFYNHLPAAEIRDAVPDAIWSQYRKVTLVRPPFDVAISMYYWQDHVSQLATNDIDFGRFVASMEGGLNFNTEITPLTGLGADGSLFALRTPA